MAFSGLQSTWHQFKKPSVFLECRDSLISESFESFLAYFCAYRVFMSDVAKFTGDLTVPSYQRSTF